MWVFVRFGAFGPSYAYVPSIMLTIQAFKNGESRSFSARQAGQAFDLAEAWGATRIVDFHGIRYLRLSGEWVSL